MLYKFHENIWFILTQAAEEDEERQSALRAEVEASLEASRGADLVVFNLFSLEGQFIACHRDIPCIAMSPHLQMRL